MKNLLLTILIAFGALITNNAEAQVLERGNIIIDAYYGFPNLYTTVFKTAYANSGTEENIEIGGIGPVGLRFEYMLADKIGLGVDVGMNNSTVSYEQDGFNYDFSTQRVGGMVTFNYHFVTTDKLDFYGMLGGGYKNRSFDFTSDDPNYIGQSTDGVFPVAARLGLGIRYFFVPNVGINLALGFGQGGIFNGGVSFKF